MSAGPYLSASALTRCGYFDRMPASGLDFLALSTEPGELGSPASPNPTVPFPSLRLFFSLASHRNA